MFRRSSTVRRPGRQVRRCRWRARSRARGQAQPLQQPPRRRPRVGAEPYVRACSSPRSSARSFFVIRYDARSAARREAYSPGCPRAIALNAVGFGVLERTRGFRNGETLELGEHILRFLETPHVHHWDSMMVVEETTNSLFPSDLYLQPGEQPAISAENLAPEMIS